MRVSRAAGGLTLTDGVLFAALAVLAAMAWWPGHAVKSVLAKEDVVVETMRVLGERLDAYRKDAKRDLDNDGRGETPALGAIVSGDDRFHPDASGTAWECDGYWFTILTPGPDRLPAQPRDDAAGADGAEATYVLVAWPVEPGVSGMRAYLRTPQDGLLRHGVDGYPYGGPDKPPVPRVTLVEHRSGTTQPLALKDGEIWVPPRETLHARDAR